MTETKTSLETDLLYGAKAIAKVLGCRPRKIYHLAERGQMPIWNEPGIGLVARKSSLEAYFKKREQQALERDGK
ncbi:DNA-binding protein [Hoeflea poritis]|uniref:DNA-binding protein n=1 Tax=Hoeflea poritis TaxID=2993659 RepID=A0ABT4VV64_9HYPH|nr:DNA-binding protein [Hoeflea poritis]MDA4847868.1 DNA-binding protein [Hoeflea poritis]